MIVVTQKVYWRWNWRSPQASKSTSLDSLSSFLMFRFAMGTIKDGVFFKAARFLNVLVCMSVISIDALLPYFPTLSNFPNVLTLSPFPVYTFAFAVTSTSIISAPSRFINFPVLRAPLINETSGFWGFR